MSQRNLYLDEIDISLPKIYSALILGNSPFYKEPSDTPILNLFENYTKSDTNNFIRLRILQYLSKKTHNIEVKQLVNFIKTTFGEDKDLITHSLSTLLKKNLVSIQPSMNTLICNLNINEHANHMICITFSGKYHVEELIYNDIYADEIKFATFLPKRIFSKVFFRNFSFSLSDRMQSTLIFLEHLKYLEGKEEKKVKRKDLYDELPKVTDIIFSRYQEKKERRETDIR